MQGKVTANSLNLRNAPNLSASIIESLPRDTIVEILFRVTGGKYDLPSGGSSSKWHEIRVDGKTGFVAEFFVLPIAPSGGLVGNIEKAPAGLLGFDCASKLTPSTIQKFVNDLDDFKFCLRYLSLEEQKVSVDLSVEEAENILDAGLALSPVQRVRFSGWVATGALGIITGKNAAKNAKFIGFPAGINVWLDLEGVKSSTSADNVKAYCNNWFDEVAKEGYVPGIYVGAGAILNGSQLATLKFEHYWESGSRVPNIPDRGYQLIQTIPNPPLGEVRHGITIDFDRTRIDDQGDQVLWLRR